MGFSDWVSSTFFKGAVDRQVALVAQNPDQLVNYATGEVLEKAMDRLPIAKRTSRPPKSLDFDPFHLVESLGWKQRPTALTYDTLRAMTLRLAVVGNIVLTRMNQVSAFAVPYRHTKTLGFAIKHKDAEHTLLKSEKKFILQLEEYILNTGRGVNPRRRRPRDDFENFLKKAVQDTLVLDQLCIERVNDRLGRPFEFAVVDGATIRIAADYIYDQLGPERRRATYFPMISWARVPPQLPNGKKPAYLQVIRGQIENLYAEDEMIFAIRNPQSNIRNNGYGQSELERIINTVTSHLFAEEFNRRQFMQGSAPKGILNIKNAEYGSEQMEAMRRQWRAQVAGVENSWRTPILAAEGLEWVNLSPTNRDAEYMQWVEYLIKVSTGAYQIDPAEINFDMRSSVSATPLFERSNESKIKNSKDRGLRPLLRFLAKTINRNIIDKIDDHFYLDFIGLDELTEDQRLEMRKNQISTYMTVNEVRKEEGMDDVDGGDTILNPIFSQRQAMLEQKEEEAQQQALMAQQPQAPDQAQPGQTVVGEKDKSGKEVGDATGAMGTAKYRALEPAGGPGKDQRLPQGTSNEIQF